MYVICKSSVTASTLANYHISELKRRLLWSAFLFLVLMIFSTHLGAQKRDTSALEKGPVRWLQVEKSFGILTEMDFVNGAMGINICRGKFIRGTQRAMAGNGYYVGVAYDTDHKITYGSFGAWIGYFRRKFGMQFGAKGVYYFTKHEQVFAVRPEAGIGFPKMQLSYGYNFLTTSAEMQLATHTLTLYVYFGVHSVRTAMY